MRVAAMMFVLEHESSRLLKQAHRVTSMGLSFIEAVRNRLATS